MMIYKALLMVFYLVLDDKKTIFISRPPLTINASITIVSDLNVQSSIKSAPHWNQMTVGYINNTHVYYYKLKEEDFENDFIYFKIRYNFNNQTIMESDWNNAVLDINKLETYKRNYNTSLIWMSIFLFLFISLMLFNIIRHRSKICESVKFIFSCCTPS
jgi:hypothetical protein